jgi:hypothetical protein
MMRRPERRLDPVGALSALALTLPAAAAAAPTTVEGVHAADLAATAQADVRLVRFNAFLAGAVPPREAGSPFKPVGKVTPMTGSDAVFGTGAAAYHTVITSNADGKGGFVDNGSIRFSNGEIRFRGIYPTKNEPTPVNGVANTVMVEEIIGGSGTFEGVTGYFLLNSTLGPGGIRGALNGVLFVKKTARN